MCGALLLGIVAAVVLIPVQALAEELLFRGFGPQLVLGKVGAGRVAYWVSAVVASGLFAALHGAATMTALGVFFILGLVFAFLVRTTGGLEAAVALHAVNNVFVVVNGLLFGQDVAAKQGEVGVDWAVVAQVVVLMGVAVVINLLARRLPRPS